jgi:hypothetical protein
VKDRFNEKLEYPQTAGAARQSMKNLNTKKDEALSALSRAP